MLKLLPDAGTVVLCEHFRTTEGWVSDYQRYGFRKPVSAERIARKHARSAKYGIAGIVYQNRKLKIFWNCENRMVVQTYRRCTVHGEQP